MYDTYRDKKCLIKFCESLREHALQTINFKKKKMTLLTNEQHKSHVNEKICYICKEKFGDKYSKDKKYCKVRNHCHYTGKYRGSAASICNLMYNVHKEIPVTFHNGSIYDCHFIIKELVKEFEGQITYLGENTEKYTTFSVPTF